jgi:hypothetical protein
MQDHYAVFESRNRTFADADDAFTATKFSVTPVPLPSSRAKFTPKPTPVIIRNQQPRLCRRTPFDLSKMEKQFVKRSNLETADDYQNYLTESVLHPDGHHDINREPPRQQQQDDDENIYADIWDGPERTNYFTMNKSRSNRWKKIATTFSKNTRRYERDDTLMEDSFGNQVRSFDINSKRNNAYDETPTLTLTDRYDLAVEEAFDISNI